MIDREIIDMLAKEFMGWDTKAWRDETDGGYQWVDIEGNYVAKYSPYEDDPRWTWNPLVDPAACALVLDELERREWCWEWRRDPIPEVRRYDFIIVGHDHPGYAVSMDNRYRAVCLAILKACEATK